ncbi:polysaccharide deacetylase family protein [Nakamurella flava]|uniref:polysaccharide deacetylase family protein n=1 Tax=Nakamurella flava TaxID=2576308 RepID=UPI00140A7423|nr:polysaccharide deacetylase family protein [Nakamurella flava]
MTAGAHRRPATRTRRTVTPILALVLALVGWSLVGVVAAPAAGAATGTVVSLTFDDANADQFAAAAKLKSKNMAGTFFMNSGFINAAGYLTLDQVRSMKADGHEIASHTISHPDLAAISLDEAKRQICNDRVNWANWGIPVANFAYPFASSTTAVENAVNTCGDNSARGLGDVRTRFSCGTCTVGETVPPAYKWYTRAPDQVESTWTLADLQKSVTQAEARNNGPWVQLTFHHICAAGAPCPAPSVTSTIFDQFVDWLAARPTTTKVKTVGAVIGGTTKAAIAGPVAPEAPAGTNMIGNASMETFDTATGLPQCFMAGGWGTNTASFAVTTDAHTGSSAVTTTVSGYQSGDAKILPTLDLGQCSPTVTAGQTYTLGEWYKSTGVTQFAVYYRTANGLWNYWTSSPWFAAASTWTQATWTTPVVPAGATAVSFGLNIFSNGTVTTDDLSMVRAVAAAAPSALRSASSTQPAAFVDAAPPPAGSAAAGGPPKKRGDVIRKSSPMPGPALPRVGRGDGRPERGIAPGAVVLAPFVVSPELTRG